MRPLTALFTEVVIELRGRPIAEMRFLGRVLDVENLAKVSSGARQRRQSLTNNMKIPGVVCGQPDIGLRIAASLWRGEGLGAGFDLHELPEYRDGLRSSAWCQRRERLGRANAGEEFPSRARFGCHPGIGSVSPRIARN